MTFRISALSLSKEESPEAFEDDSQEHQRTIHAIKKVFTFNNL
jgi:hypothetical protein